MAAEPSDCTIPCPVCDGHGGFVHQICCGRGRTECCGEPDIDFERCHACGGAGCLPIESEAK